MRMYTNAHDTSFVARPHTFGLTQGEADGLAGTSQEQQVRLGVDQHGNLTPARITQIRQRVLRGYYTTTAIADVVARRILEKGEL